MGTVGANEWEGRYHQLRSLIRQCSATVTVTNEEMDKAKGSHDALAAKLRLSREMAAGIVAKSDAMFTTDNDWGGTAHILTSIVSVVNPVLLAELDRETRERSG